MKKILEMQALSVKTETGSLDDAQWSLASYSYCNGWPTSWESYHHC